MSKSSAAKKSIIVGGLIGTGGLFVSKLIGLAYTIPFSYILQSEAYQSVYAQSYNIYAYLLTIFQSGVPFAVATLVARYMALEDAKSVILVKKLAFAILGLTGFVGMILLFTLSNVIAPAMVAKNADIMANCLRILSLAIFLVPVLSAFRGYYQGLKEMEEYAFSQAFEQVFRVAFLLSTACLVVYAFGWNKKYALYAAVLSTSVATIAAIAQFIHFDRNHQLAIDEMAQMQTKSMHSAKTIFKEILVLAIPYLVVAILGNIDQIFNSFLLPTGLKMHYNVKDTTTVISASNYVAGKLNAIPMILGPGFATAIIPHISEALSKKNYKLVKKNVIDSINVVLYVAIPVSFCIFVYAGPLNYTLYYSENLELCTYVVQWMSLEGFLGTIAPLITNLMVSLEIRKNVLKNLAIGVLIKGILLIPFVWIFGLAGAVLSSMIGNGYTLYKNLKEIHDVYAISYRKTVVVIVRILIGLVALWVTSILLSKIGLSGVEGSKLVCLFKMCLNGLLSVIVYLVVTLYLKVPQSIFHFKLKRNRV
ncbi:teichoic acid transporter [Eubacterium sp. AF22-8LB]|uniref:oligosaccharide flippase family protein n=1 Tax=Eubacterium sp. AF22-8LB TaxID=2292232 RepID=UPI000E494523|nr:oligosaccharide flippase family protein [Eubacterium sp. AF22-8LB]RGS29060.1 teichoic acid transporter [Eubacterium sp. AF22-8LB]